MNMRLLSSLTGPVSGPRRLNTEFRTSRARRTLGFMDGDREIRAFVTAAAGPHSMIGATMEKLRNGDGVQQ
jgi:hypothetical protein